MSLVALLSLFLVGVSASPGQLWNWNWATEGRIPLVGDADGDGHADLLVLYPGGNEAIVDCSRTSPLGKPTPNVMARRNFGREGRAACTARITQGPGVDVVGIMRDGSVRVAYQMKRGENVYQRDAHAATIPPALLPAAPLQALGADFSGDGRDDVLVRGSEGRLVLLVATATPEPSFTVHPVAGTPLQGTRTWAAGALSPDPRARLVWLDKEGKLRRSVLTLTPTTATLAPPALVLTTAPEAQLAVGKFLGQPRADILIGRTLLPEGDPKQAVELPNLPTISEARDDSAWLVGDFDANGKDDLLRKQEKPGWGGVRDTFIHYFAAPSDASQGFISSVPDGLLDDWKRGKVHPGGLNLAELGCKVGRRDLIVEIGSFDYDDQERIRRDIGHVINYFRSLPFKNADGSIGIELHPIYHVFPGKDRDAVYADFDARYPPPEHVGITHYFFADTRGPLVAQIGGHNGHYNGSWKHFIHELGHNLGLLHEGFWDGPAFTALYPSVMNYTFNGEIFPQIPYTGYSSGVLSGRPYEEKNLPERLPASPEALAYLTKPPYYFQIRPSEKKNETLVDWNWNGVFGEESVQADINYLPFSIVAARCGVGFGHGTPTLVATEEPMPRLIALWPRLPAGTALGTTVSASKPATLVARYWQGTDPERDGNSWSPELVFAQDKAIGEVVACAQGSTLWLAYPTATGVTVQTLQGGREGQLTVGSPRLIPQTVGLTPTLVRTGQRPLLILWEGFKRPLQLGVVPAADEPLSNWQAQTLPLFSKAPPGACLAEAGAILLSLVQDRDAGKPNGLRVATLQLLPSDPAWKIRKLEWVGGTNGRAFAEQRSVPFWEPMAGMPEGRVHVLAAGMMAGGRNARHYIAMQIANRELDIDWSLSGGWLTRAYQPDDQQSPSGPGACFWGKDIAYLVRTFDKDEIVVSFFGRGVEPGRMGDCDDITQIGTAGLFRSIAQLRH